MNCKFRLRLFYEIYRLTDIILHTFMYRHSTTRILREPTRFLLMEPLIEGRRQLTKQKRTTHRQNKRKQKFADGKFNRTEWWSTMLPNWRTRATRSPNFSKALASLRSHLLAIHCWHRAYTRTLPTCADSAPDTSPVDFTHVHCSLWFYPDRASAVIFFRMAQISYEGIVRPRRLAADRQTVSPATSAVCHHDFV
jgi:hypothetical protein